MYKTHQPLIRKYALQSPKHTLHVISFVLASINQRFHRVAKINETIRKTGDTAHFTQYQRRGWQEICSRALEIYEFVCDESVSAYAALDFYSDLPGFGLAKAGFLAQLFHGKAGCLDRHWLKSLGLSPNTFNASGASVRRKSRLMLLYLETLEDVGDCEYLWDAWCHTVASMYPDKFQDAEDVSEYHLRAITGEGKL